MKLPPLPPGMVWHHLSLRPADWPVGVPPLDLKRAPNATKSVAWAYDPQTSKLVPMEIPE